MNRSSSLPHRPLVPDTTAAATREADASGVLHRPPRARTVASSRASERGFSLLELLVAAVVSLAVLVGVSSLLTGSERLGSASRAELDSARSLALALEVLSADLETSGAGRITVSNDNQTGSSVLVYQTALPGADGQLRWGADGVEGQQLEVRIDGSRLVRRTLASDGTLVRERVLADRVDIAQTSPPPFEVQWVGAALNVTLRLQFPDLREGGSRSATTTVLPRNPGS